MPPSGQALHPYCRAISQRIGRTGAGPVLSLAAMHMAVAGGVQGPALAAVGHQGLEGLAVREIGQQGALRHIEIPGVQRQLVGGHPLLDPGIGEQVVDGNQDGALFAVALPLSRALVAYVLAHPFQGGRGHGDPVGHEALVMQRFGIQQVP